MVKNNSQVVGLGNWVDVVLLTEIGNVGKEIYFQEYEKR